MIRNPCAWICLPTSLSVRRATRFPASSRSMASPNRTATAVAATRAGSFTETAPAATRAISARPSAGASN